MRVGVSHQRRRLGKERVNGLLVASNYETAMPSLSFHSPTTISTFTPHLLALALAWGHRTGPLS